MKKIDLHTHTRASDGLLGPVDLMDRAMENGIDVLAITDHDTVAGLDEAVRYAAGKKVTLVPGIEFSVEFHGPGTFHLVGLNIDYTNGDLCAAVARLSALRGARAFRMVEDLRRHNIAISIDEVEREAGGGAVGKPHIARVLVRHGYVPDINTVFERYLEKGKPGYVEKEKITLEEAISLIKNSQGIPIVAHPVSLGLSGYDEYTDLIRKLIPLGLRGMEVYADMHTDYDVEMFHSIARKYGLLISGGSDFHGDRDERLGYYAGKIIPGEIWETLGGYIS